MEPIERKLKALLKERERVILAIDGPCASGKTTLARRLAQKFDANLIHMDDFFLRPEQRSPERLSEPGGNLDRERFFEEVITPLLKGVPFSYRPYLCSEGRLGKPISMAPKGMTIIEGSYSHHPYFGDPYDCKLFCTVSKEEQKRRILLREAHLHARFFQEWIPMEEQYFRFFKIEEQADYVIR